MIAMSKFPAITKDIPVPISLGMHLALLGSVLYAGMQLQELKAVAEKQWSIDMEGSAWDKFHAINRIDYPDLEIPDVYAIRKNHVAANVQIPFRIAEN